MKSYFRYNEWHFNLNSRFLAILFYVFLLTLGPGCTAPEPKTWPPSSDGTMIDSQHPKNLFVFLDGTANNPSSATNVYRLYEMISQNNDPYTKSIYIEGVGTRDSLWTLTGMILGLGMEERILMGYKFLALNYQPGDQIYIFGFSRGAHQARSLAGLLAYAGLPEITDEYKDRLMKIGNQILELTKEKSDINYKCEWSSWTPGQAPLLAKAIKKQHNLDMQPVEVTFLGIWDTVPGSFFKTYGTCKEEEDGREGDRYKSDSYPPIRHIAHAVSLDEKRSKFRQLLVCPAINENFTKIDEVWFPGAHADVGGGYDEEGSKELPNISLNWMLDLLSKNYSFQNGAPQKQPSKATGLAHWSMGDSPGNWFSDCEDRPFRPSFSSDQIDSSFKERKMADKVPILMHDELEDLKYPILCPNE